VTLTLHVVYRTGRGGLARHEHALTSDRGPAGSATAAGAGGLTGDTTMSVEAICWALNLAPVPTDRGGQPSSACKCSSAWPTTPGPTAPARSRQWPR
jgi:hypothetical protein